MFWSHQKKTRKLNLLPLMDDVKHPRHDHGMRNAQFHPNSLLPTIRMAFKAKRPSQCFRGPYAIRIAEMPAVMELRQPVLAVLAFVESRSSAGMHVRGRVLQFHGFVERKPDAPRRKAVFPIGRTDHPRHHAENHHVEPRS